MPELPPRKVVRHDYFNRHLARLLRDERAAADFALSAEYLLARDPTIGTRISRVIWLLPMARVPSRQISLYYEFDDTTVRFRDIKAFP